MALKDTLKNRLSRPVTEKSRDKMVKLGDTETFSIFSGLFGATNLSDKEENHLKTILVSYKKDGQALGQDFDQLCRIISEVHAISCQAVLLHGERIERAHAILKKYKVGAFSEYLVLTYGNRQTPYNFWQYYKFYNIVPIELREKFKKIPRQVIYSLASRGGEVEKKIEFIREIDFTESKKQNILLRVVRKSFPAIATRKESSVNDKIISLLEEVKSTLKSRRGLSKEKKRRYSDLLQDIKESLRSF